MRETNEPTAQFSAGHEHCVLGLRLLKSIIRLKNY